MAKQPDANGWYEDEEIVTPQPSKQYNNNRNNYERNDRGRNEGTNLHSFICKLPFMPEVELFARFFFLLKVSLEETITNQKK
jgi:hypothetical protein